MSTANAILQACPLGFPWETLDPFLFCVYHDDRYPKGNAQFGPDAPLAGRNMHSEMFPLLDPAAPNPLELFQIWLNLPARSKTADPHFTMLLSEHIPRHLATDAEDRRTEFGGWPWPDNARVHGAEHVRFAKHADGHVEMLATQPVPAEPG